MLRRSTRKRVSIAASIGQGASARKTVMTSSPPAVTSSSVSSAVMSTLPAVGFPELLYSRVPQRPSTSTVGVTGQMPLMSILPQRYPVITAGETVPQPSTGLVSQQIPVITAGETVPLPSTGLVSQQIPVITAGLTVPQPSTGLDWQCDAGNMHVIFKE